MFLQAAPHQQVEFLVGAAQLHVGLQGDRIVALHQRIQEFMDGDRLLRGVALGEIVTLQHAGHGELAGQLDHVRGRHLAEPLGIEAQLGLFAIQHLEHLVGVGAGIGLHVFARQRLAGGILATGVADHAGEVADQENDLMPQVLELAHLVQQDGMADMQVGRGRVEAGLDAQGPAQLEAGLQLFALEDFIGATADQFECCCV